MAGSSAFSSFRAANLQRLLGVEAVRAVWLHYVEVDEGIPDESQETLRQLLDYGDAQLDVDDECYQELLAAVAGPGSPSSSPRTQVFYVTPRPGTISPWSSKATSIAVVSGLGSEVKRIERGMVIAVKGLPERSREHDMSFADVLHDRMTQTIGTHPPDLSVLFMRHDAAPARTVDMHGRTQPPRDALREANVSLGLALDPAEMQYLEDVFGPAGQLVRDPTDVELFMFAQVNSEHCRHKQFNAEWVVDGVKKPHSLFGMIKSTHQRNPDHTLSAYSDNAAVFHGPPACLWEPSQATGRWTRQREVVHFLGKVETHNHPTAVSPYPGAATGSGGEIRDEGAVGRGSKPKAGLAGFSVSDLLIPGHRRPWELDVGRPNHIASSLDIVLEAPVGAAAFNNEFGRPCTAGYLRTLLTETGVGGDARELRGYHKPIMIAGGVGTVRPQNAIKDARVVRPGAHVVVLGGPAMLIGLGGGASSSLTSGEGLVDLDFASVQRGNPEMQRRTQMVIDACTALGEQNPIQLIHDVGAGGLSNALPELVHDAGLGAKFELREIESADRGLSPLQIWCCEAQERYVLIVGEDGLPTFRKIARRERCGYSVVGRAVGGPEAKNRLIVTDRDSADFPKPVDLPMSVLFGRPPRMSRTVGSRRPSLARFDSSLVTYLPGTPHDGLLQDAVDRVLTLPAVGSKAFLITIGDRTVGGLVVQDQMAGPWQVPVADVSVTATALMPGIATGEAMAMGERPTLALISPAASARMAIAEALTNLAAADITDRLERVRLSANWMAASGHPGEGAALYEAVEAVALGLCPRLGISIPVGKDSMSMKMRWEDADSKEKTEVTAPLSLVVSAFAPVSSVARTWTPTLRRFEDVGESILLFVDLADGRRALGGSALAQVYGEVGDEAPDVRDASLLKDFFDAVQQLHEAGIVLAYHDRSDGGLFTTLVEMMFAGRCGLVVMLDHLAKSTSTPDVVEALFNEELGGVFQVRKEDQTEFHRCFATCGPPPGLIKRIGTVPRASRGERQELVIQHGLTTVYRQSRAYLQQRWSHTSYALQRLRDNPACADAEYAAIDDDLDRGLNSRLTFKPSENIMPLTSTISSIFTRRPRVAILREQGINGHAEMAFAFDQAGFAAIDVHMTDIIGERVSLATFTGLAACGGFSYGDVLGAGRGWAKSVLLHSNARQEFQAFFERKDTFTLGVCNGAQFLARLTELIPGTDDWPVFEGNESEQYEARLCMVEVSDQTAPSLPDSSSSVSPPPPCIFFHGMHGSRLPVAVAHAEGKAVFRSAPPQSPPPPPSSSSASSPPSQASTTATAPSAGCVAIRYIDPTSHAPTESYPSNPNGSGSGIAGVRSADGRVLAMMPHPERMILRDAGGNRAVMGRTGTAAADINSSSSGREDDDDDAGPYAHLGPWSRLFLSSRRWVG